MSTSELFETVTSKVKNSPPLPLSESLKLKLYGLYKRSVVGTTTEANESAPSFLNIVARKKWNAWLECNGMSQEESMLGYVKLVADIDCDLGRETRELLNDFETKKHT